MADKKHFVALDGLRGVAALAVVVLHAAAPFGYLPFPHAVLAVDFFFALSGFVVAFAYEDRLAGGLLSFRAFLGRRLARLHPLIVASVLFGTATYGANYVLLEHGEPWRVAVAVVFGLLLIPFGGLSPNTLSSHPLNPPTWTLFAEYLANITYGLICRRLNTAGLILIIVAAAALEGFVLISHGSLEIGNDFADWPIGVARVVFPFFAGVGLFRLWKAGRFHGVRIPFAALSIALLLVFAAPKTGWIDAAAVFVIFPAIIAAGTHDIKWPPLSNFAAWTGKLSYPLYIVHYPLVWIFHAAAEILGLRGPLLMGFILVEVVAMVVLAFVALKFYDEPVRAYLAARSAARRGPKQPPSGSLEIDRSGADPRFGQS